MILEVPSLPWWKGVADLCPTPAEWHAWKWRRSLLYRRLATEVAEALELGPAYYQIEPNLRIQETGATAVDWHTDADFGHSPDEWNVWVPLTILCDPTQHLWVRGEETEFPVPVRQGQAWVFQGGRIAHGNQVNTGPERRSFDFRLIARGDYDRHYGDGTERRTVFYDVPMTVGSYWSELD